LGEKLVLKGGGAGGALERGGETGDSRDGLKMGLWGTLRERNSDFPHLDESGEKKGGGLLYLRNRSSMKATVETGSAFLKLKKNRGPEVQNRRQQINIEDWGKRERCI